MKQMTPATHERIVRYTLYGLLVQWIPVPFADYIAGNIVRRQLISGISKAYDAPLTKSELKTLADEKMGCMYGCVVNILFFPVKLLLGKLLLLLRFKQFLNAAGRNYHAARLMEYVIREQRMAPVGPYSAKEVRMAVDQVCDTADIDSVRAVFRQILNRKTAVLKDAAVLFWRALVSVAGRRDEAKLELAVDGAKDKASDAVRGVLTPLVTALEAIPPEHFTRLESELEGEMRRLKMLALD